LIAKATSPTAPPLVRPKSGSRTASPKTGVAEVASISALDNGGRPAERLHHPQEQPRNHEKPGMGENQCQDKTTLLQQKIFRNLQSMLTNRDAGNANVSASLLKPAALVRIKGIALAGEVTEREDKEDRS